MGTLWQIVLNKSNKGARLALCRRTGVGAVFTRDYLFTSPSMAAMAVMGRSANGWIEWKAANGKTLDEAKRQVVGVAG